MAITTIEDAKNAVRELSNAQGGNTWADLYKSNYFAGEMQKGALRSSYSDAMAEAYKSSLEQRADIAGSNIGQGFKEQYTADIDAALDAAYDQYIGQQTSGLQAVAGNVAENKAAIDEALLIEATNTLGVKNAVEDYYNWVYNWYAENSGDGRDNLFLSDPYWRQYLVEVGPDEQLPTEDVTYITEGEGDTAKQYRLKTFEELGKEPDFYNDDMSLGGRGSDFYKKMLNYFEVSGDENKFIAPSFSKYLQNTNKELYDWTKSSNVYSYTPDVASRSRNIGVVREVLGMSSNEEQWSEFTKKYKLTDTELEGLLQPLTKLQKAVQELPEFSTDSMSMSREEYDKYVKSGGADLLYKTYEPMLDEIEKYAKQLDLGGDVDWTELKNYVRQSISDKETGFKMIGDVLTKTGVGAAGGAVIGGPYGAVLGGLASLALAISQQNDSANRNLETANNIRSLYLNVLNNLTEEAKSRL